MRPTARDLPIQSGQTDPRLVNDILLLMHTKDLPVEQNKDAAGILKCKMDILNKDSESISRFFDDQFFSVPIPLTKRKGWGWQLDVARTIATVLSEPMTYGITPYDAHAYIAKIHARAEERAANMAESKDRPEYLAHVESDLKDNTKLIQIMSFKTRSDCEQLQNGTEVALVVCTKNGDTATIWRSNATEEREQAVGEAIAKLKKEHENEVTFEAVITEYERTTCRTNVCGILRSKSLEELRFEMRHALQCQIANKPLRKGESTDISDNLNTQHADEYYVRVPYEDDTVSRLYTASICQYIL